MISKPIFSIIIPVYNHCKTLGRSIESVLNQTFSSFELIIVNDGSTEDVYTVVKSYMLKDERIFYLEKENGGVSDARNKGVEIANANYICFLDADDEYYCNHLETLEQMISEYKNCSMFVTSHETVLVDGKSIFSNKVLNNIISLDNCYETDDIFTMMWKPKGTIIHINSVCIEKKTFDEVGGFEVGVKIGEDIDLFCRISIHDRIVFSKETTTKRYREDSVASRNGNFIYDWIFEKRISTILNDNTISNEKKNKIKIYLNTRTMRKVLHYTMEGNRKKAKNEFKSIYSAKCGDLKYKVLYIRAMLGLCLPSVVLNTIFNHRSKGFFR